MKISGQAIPKPKNEIAVLPRGETTIVFTAKAVLDYSEFDELCPEPTPTIRNYPDGRQEVVRDNSFTKKQEAWARLRSAWTVLESLKATDGLEWETVDYTKPDTWQNYNDELRKDFSTGEVNEIMGAVMRANSLDDSRFEEARNVFLAKEQQV